MALKSKTMNKYIMPSLEDLVFQEEEMYGYLINSYMQYAQNEINNINLHPITPHTKTLLENCNSWITSIDNLEKSMPQELYKFDHEKWKFEYKKIHFDDIVDQMYIKLVSIKKKVFQVDIQLKNIYNEIEKSLMWDLVGLPVSNKTSGLLFTRNLQSNLVDTYDFSISKTVSVNRTPYVTINHQEKWEYSPTTNFITKKHEYIKNMSKIESTPFCLAVMWDKPLSPENTILPIIYETLPTIMEKIGLL